MHTHTSVVVRPHAAPRPKRCAPQHTDIHQRPAAPSPSRRLSKLMSCLCGTAFACGVATSTFVAARHRLALLETVMPVADGVRAGCQVQCGYWDVLPTPALCGPSELATYGCDPATRRCGQYKACCRKANGPECKLSFQRTTRVCRRRADDSHEARYEISSC